MQHLKIKITIILLFIANIILGQNTKITSNLKDFEGIWQFIPPKWSNDTTFISLDLISNSKRVTLFFRKHNNSVHTIGPMIIGFEPENKKIAKLSDLVDIGKRMCFYETNPQAPNDSIKYYKQASPSCSASYNGDAIEEEKNPPEKGQPNYFTFSFNGRENEYCRQIHHLPQKIIVALLKNKKELDKVTKFLQAKFSSIIVNKSIIYSQPNQSTKMYLIKNDPIEILEKKNNWFKIKYYPEKNGVWSGKIIKGWIKRSDVE